MSSKECETQLNELLEAWDLDEATLSQTDIEAIKHLLLENQMQQDVIISYKTTNLDQAVDIQQLEQENKQLKEVIDEVRERSKLERKTALSLNQHYAVSIIDSVLQILDKVKEDK